MKPKTTRETKLDETISSIDADRLESTRQTISEEIAEAQAEVDAKSMKAKEPVKSIGKTQAVKVLAEMTEKNDERTEKLDLITDIQLILVDRFQKLSKLMLVATVLMGLGLVAMAAGLAFGLSISNQVTNLLERQEALVKSIDEAKASVEEAKASVDQTQAKVDQVADKVPEVEVDPETGETSVLLPQKQKQAPPEPAPTASASSGGPPPGHDPPAPPAPPTGKIRVPLK